MSYCFWHHLGASGCLPSSHIPARSAHALYIPFSPSTRRGSLKAWRKMLNVSGRSSLVIGWNWVVWQSTHRGVVQIKQKDDLASWFLGAGDMELKKSISDTERALRSYGSVSETAWTTDKGEHHASEYLFISAPQLGSARSRLWFVRKCFTLWKPSEQAALKWLMCDSQRFGIINSATLVLKGLLIPLHAHHGYCAVCEWIWAKKYPSTYSKSRVSKHVWSFISVWSDAEARSKSMSSFKAISWSSSLINRLLTDLQACLSIVSSVWELTD